MAPIYAKVDDVRILTLLPLLGLVALAGCTDANQSNTAPSAAGVTCDYPAQGEPARAADPPDSTHVPDSGEVQATLELTAGKINITMDRAKAPCTVNSFVSLAEQGYFDDTDCHRLTDTGIFVLQCGDPSGTGTGGPGYTVPDELTEDLTYPAGTVAMANTGSPNTGGSQFFLVYADTELPPEYTVFGSMDQAGIDVVGGIAAQGVDAGDKTSPIAEAHITKASLG